MNRQTNPPLAGRPLGRRTPQPDPQQSHLQTVRQAAAVRGQEEEGRAAERRPLAIYYGPGALPSLAKFARVVVQPGHFTPEKVRWLQKRGVQVLAYLSLGEDGNPPGEEAVPWHSGEHNPDWNTALVDAAHPAWHAHIYNQVINTPEFDGYFLDTLDSASRNLRQTRAMLRLVRSVRQWAGPDRYLLANRGFDLLHRLRRTVDGVLIEPLSTTWAGSTEGRYRIHTPQELHYTEVMVNQARRHRLEVFGVDYADTPALRRFAIERAADLGVPIFVTNRELSLPGGYSRFRPKELTGPWRIK
ncbi:endo alpha-1,4 polygalactosaminidase [Deinococcus sp.]|uniref:endo alpha-1,4 polygalactosaminidase n=1 Tax=Deinococcus sp. TaxID=47478 RepID=UPI003CC67490